MATAPVQWAKPTAAAAGETITVFITLQDARPGHGMGRETAAAQGSAGRIPRSRDSTGSPTSNT
ncbi:hypothetical protein B8W90_13950, partial [Staphylococcus hominis]